MIRITDLTNNDWGLALYRCYLTGDVTELLEMKAEVEGRGYRFSQRIIIDASEGLDRPMFLFWGGHPWLDAPIDPGFTPRWAMDKCVELGIYILPVVSTFHPAKSGEYNDDRHDVAQSVINALWTAIISGWGLWIVACQVDNEPYTGGDAYPRDEYERRVRREAAHIQALGLKVIATKFSGAGVSRDEHMAIGGITHEFPPLYGTKTITEAWERPGVKDGYVRYTEWALDHESLWLIGYNFGSKFIKRKLRWGEGWYETFLWDERDLTPKGAKVLDMLGAVADPPPPPPPDPVDAAYVLVNDVLVECDIHDDMHVRGSERKQFREKIRGPLKQVRQLLKHPTGGS